MRGFRLRPSLILLFLRLTVNSTTSGGCMNSLIRWSLRAAIPM
uniref:Uncharacterized protein n=1 Tax=Arundo donax TaxID=35708 RepID=A0A0A9HT69_ARUDO